MVATGGSSGSSSSRGKAAGVKQQGWSSRQGRGARDSGARVRQGWLHALQCIGTWWCGNKGG